MENSLRKATQTAPKAKWREGELLVRFRKNLSDSEIEALLQAGGAQRAGRLRGKSGIERVRLMPSSDLEAVAASLRSSRKVDFAEPNYLITADQTQTQSAPDDPRFPEQWALKNTGQNSNGYFGSDISAGRAWGLTTGSSQTVIAIIDSGADFTHPELRNNEWNNSLEKDNTLDDDKNNFTDDLHGWDFITDSKEIKDEQGHGTAVAGIISAQGNNATGITGVMWRASLMSLRVLDNTGTGDVASAVEAIHYAIQNGAQVINCSWGTDDNSIALLEAINWASRKGVVVVASAGNHGRDIESAPRYPASYDSDNLIAVASTDNSDLLTSWSNWGATHIKLAAPGKDILTTKMGGDYQMVSGSSASAPFVAGIAGLVKTLRPWLNAKRTQAILVHGVRKVPALSGKVSSGGVVSAAGVLETLNALPPNEGLNENNGNNGGEHGNNGNGRRNPRDNQPGGGNRDGNGNRDGREFSVAPLAPIRGVPATGLPNLDELRGKQSTNPKAPDAVPSTRCAHHDPDCSRRRQAAIQAPVGLLAWGLNPALAELFSADNSRPVSDTSFQLFRSAVPGAALALPQPQSWTSATFVKTDTTTQGNWKGKYGAEGYNIINDAVSYPAYAQVVPGNNLLATWNASTSDVRALQKTASTTDRLAACWYQSSYFTIDVNITDGQTHQVALYNLDWDGNNARSQQIDIRDATTNTLLDSRSVSSFSGGKYLVWNLSGHVVIYVARTGSWNSVVSGLFFDATRTNVALSSKGSVATASSIYNSNYIASGAINGENWGLNYGSGGVWHSGATTFPQWLQIDFNGTKTIDEIDVYTIQNSYMSPSQPTAGMTFTLYGLTAFDVQYWNGTSWMTVPGGSVSGNNKVWRKLAFSPVTTGKIRVLTNASPDGWSRIAEVEAYGTEPTSTADYTTPRVDPYNRTGSGGVDLLSGNANWSLPLLGLKGRAGLDLGLALSYNSLVWTKSQDGTSIKFDADVGTPSPGFQLGFPVIQAPYVNAQTGKTSYLLITPSGDHVDLRQVGTSNIYEAGDSSFLQLTDNGGSLTLRPTDGSQLSFELKNGQYYCYQIKDRNGNFIDIVNHDDGRINTIKDTLGRIVTFVYDSFSNLKEITQQWMVSGQLVTHKWATFGWSNQTINPGFYGLTVVGPQNNTSLPMLTSVGLGDGTYYKFRYNSWGQVDKVTFYAANSLVNGQMMDTHPLNYTLYTHTLPVSANDCPRVTQSKQWAENWNNNQEAATTYFLATDHSSGEVTFPDSTIKYKELFATSGWQRGLTTGTQYWSGAMKQKETATTYTQTNTGLNYQQNPRVIETNVSDAGSQRRTVIEYGTPSSDNEKWNLPSRVIEYAADAATEIRHTFTGYNFDPQYINRRIIGLVNNVNISDTHVWESIVYYAYDAGGTQLVATPNATIQHDAAYDTSAAAKWRGNLTTVTRYDVQDINNANKRAVTQIGYNTNGSVIFSQDPLNHKTIIKYEDSFSDTSKNSLNTYAYPTTVTPPLAATGESEASFSSTSQYDYYMGVVTRTQGAVPAGQTQGPVQTFEYDSAGRISRVNNLVNNAYQRWVYDPAGHVSTYTLVQTGGQEAFSSTVFDGMGRVRGASGDHPNSFGTFRGQLTQYDVMGRVFKQSNPAEIDSNWAPVGEDAAGMVYTQQAYDWKGRPTVTINPDGTTKSATYGGCGCAGGEVIAVRDEIGRQQRVTSDVLGRKIKTEVLDYYPSQTVYSTTTNTYNARDQVTSVYEQVGSNGAGQTTTLTYDGHGRLKTQQVPAQIAANAVTTYAYNDDDTVKNVTDGRGVVTAFTYNQRQQVTDISYTLPSGSNLANTGAVAFTYDAAGNRTSMTDGSGSVSYVYDQLSRLTSESRTFNGLSGIVRTLSYTYNLTNELTSVTDPFGEVVNYAYDKAGRMTDVTGSSFGGVTQYAANARYRAWGALKSVSYGNGRALAVQHNARLQVTRFDIPGVITKEYQYHADGQLRYSQDVREAKLDRSYAYDHVGRLTQALSGIEARDGQSVGGLDRPYNETFQYDQMNHLTGRSTRYWDELYSLSDQYVNDRNTHLPWSYDADGRVLWSPDVGYVYDAAGSVIAFGDFGDVKTEQKFDGDGSRVRSEAWKFNEATWTWHSEQVTYYVSSSVLGGAVVTELDGSGAKKRTFVRAGGSILAWQSKGGGMGDSVEWEHRDASNASFRATDATGQVIGETVGGRGEAYQQELDPVGADAGLAAPPAWNPPLEGVMGSLLPYPRMSDPGHPGVGYSYNGVPVSADEFRSHVEPYFPSGFGFAVLNQTTRIQNYRWVKRGTVIIKNLPTGPDDPDGNTIRIGAEIARWEIGNWVPTALSLTPSLSSIFAGFNLPQNRIEIINTGGDTAFEQNKDSILALISRMSDPKGPCAAAFKRAGLPTPEEIINKGLILGSRKALTDAAYNEALGLTDAKRNEYNNTEGSAVTVWGSKGKPIILFSGNSFRDKQYLEDVPHEFIHAAGIGKLRFDPGHPFPFLSWGNDLSHFPPYQDIINSCK